MQNLRVLHIAPSLNVMGGISAVLRDYLSTSLPRQHELCFVTSHKDGSKLKKLIVSLMGLCRTLCIMATEDIDIVHIHCGDIPSPYRKYLYYRLVRLFRPKVILHLHGALFIEQLSKAPRYWQNRLKWFFENSDIVICLSKSWSDAIGVVFPGTKRMIIPNGVLLPVMPRPKGAGPVRLTFLGLIGARKGVFDLVKVVKRLVADGCDMYLDIGGNGDVDRLKKEIVAVKDRIRFHGWIRGEDKKKLLTQTDIYVLPSCAEGMPISLLEAMSYGIPVISTRVGGIPELVEDGRSGFLIAPGDQAALYASLKNLLENPSTRAEMGKEARNKIMKNHNIHSITKMVSDLYVHLKFD